jgi:hypothetical protein
VLFGENMLDVTANLMTRVPRSVTTFSYLPARPNDFGPTRNCVATVAGPVLA